MTDEHMDDEVEVKGKGRRKGKGDPFGGIFWGLTLIWLGVTFLLNLKDWFNIFLVGLGCIFIVDAILRQMWDVKRKSVVGSLITGIVLIVLGLAFLFKVITWWPLIPIIIGAGILISGITKARMQARG
jgi:uncharacterized membrane protein HdeD (DUF308 family)